MIVCMELSEPFILKLMKLMEQSKPLATVPSRYPPGIPPTRLGKKKKKEGRGGDQQSERIPDFTTTTDAVEIRGFL